MEIETMPEKFFLIASGGNNRKWAKRYGKMLESYEILKTLGANEDVLKGFKLCMDIFSQKIKERDEN